MDINAELNFSPLQSICDCALYYVGAVYESLEDPDLYDATGRFRATEKVKQGFMFVCLPAEVNCLVIVCSLDIYNNCCSSKTSFVKAAVWLGSTETALKPSGNISLIALFIWMNKQWATSPWKKGKPLHKTHFVQYQASSPALGWLGDGDCYLMHKVQSDSWLYSDRNSSK